MLVDNIFVIVFGVFYKSGRNWNYVLNYFRVLKILWDYKVNIILFYFEFIILKGYICL